MPLSHGGGVGALARLQLLGAAKVKGKPDMYISATSDEETQGGFVVQRLMRQLGASSERQLSEMGSRASFTHAFVGR